MSIVLAYFLPLAPDAPPGQVVWRVDWAESHALVYAIRNAVASVVWTLLYTVADELGWVLWSAVCFPVAAAHALASGFLYSVSRKGL